MNQRIGDNKVYLLAKEAGLIEFEKFAWNPELVSPTQESVAKAHKFAELFIKECSATIQDFVDHRIPASEYPERLKQYYGFDNKSVS